MPLAEDAPPAIPLMLPTWLRLTIYLFFGVTTAAASAASTLDWITTEQLAAYSQFSGTVSGLFAAGNVTITYVAKKRAAKADAAVIEPGADEVPADQVD